MSLVVGPNGEQDLDDGLRSVALRTLADAPTERVGGRRFSLWKTDAPLSPRPPRFSPAFFAVTLGGSAVLFATARWAVQRVREGDFRVGAIFGIAFMVVLYGGMTLAVVRSRRSPKGPHTPLDVPEGIPRDAILVRASVAYRGQCVGWLWFEGDLMVFRGAGYDFRLRREDFVSKEDVLKQLRAASPLALRNPKGISQYRLFVSPVTPTQGGLRVDRRQWDALEGAFASWESGRFTHEPSLFPPIRPVPTKPQPIGWKEAVLPTLFMATLLGMAGLLLPFEPLPNGQMRSPWGLAAIGALFGLFWPLLLWTSDRTSRSYTREVDRAATRATETSSV